MVTPLGKIPKLAGGGKVWVGQSGGGRPGLSLSEVMAIAQGWWGEQSALQQQQQVFAQMAATDPELRPHQSWKASAPALQSSLSRLGYPTAAALNAATAAASAPTPRVVDSNNSTNINVYVTVEGSIRSDRELAKVIEGELVRAIRRGGSSELLS
jgi:hypothetical protein